MNPFLAGVLAIAIVTFPFGRASGQAIAIKASQTLLVLNQKWADAYKAKHPGADIQVTGDDTVAAFASLANKKADLIVVPRAIHYAEAQLCVAAFGQRATDNKVAVCGLAVYVHTNNPVKVIEYDELAKIFRGQSQNWKELDGGKDQTITVYAQATNSVLGELFEAEVLEGTEFSSRVQILAGPDMLSAVAANSNSIGFDALVPYAGVQALSIKRAHSSTPVDPTEDNIARRIYPISRYVYSYGNPTANAEPIQAYLNWIRSDEGQQVAKAAGFYELPANLRSNQ